MVLSCSYISVDCQKHLLYLFFAARVVCDLPSNLDSVLFLAWLCPHVNTTTHPQAIVYGLDDVTKWDLTSSQDNVSPHHSLSVMILHTT